MIIIWLCGYKHCSKQIYFDNLNDWEKEKKFGNQALDVEVPWQQIKFSGLDKIHMFGRRLLKEHF